MKSITFLKHLKPFTNIGPWLSVNPSNTSIRLTTIIYYLHVISTMGREWLGGNDLPKTIYQVHSWGQIWIGDVLVHNYSSIKPWYATVLYIWYGKYGQMQAWKWSKIKPCPCNMCICVMLEWNNHAYNIWIYTSDHDVDFSGVLTDWLVHGHVLYAHNCTILTNMQMVGVVLWHHTP